MKETVCYLNTWKRFVNEGVLDSARLNKRVMESWYRCKKEQVNPYLNKGENILTNELLHLQREKNSLLLDVVSPHVDRMNEAIRESGMMALLVDPDGYVLSLLGNEKIVEDARKINFIEGVRWTEREVGTNAIGTALQTKEAVTINGTEHYSIASHQWSCSATPILTGDGLLMGVLDISCPVEYSHPFMLGMVASVAYEIEREISKRLFKRELALFQRSVELTDKYRDRPFVVCNDNDVIVSASKPLREKVPQSIGMSISQLLRYGYQVDIQTAFSLKEDKQITGTCLFLSEGTSDTKRRQFTGSNSAQTFYFNGEAGRSEAFQRTMKQVKLVSPTDVNVYIFGETGTGKEVIARAIHDNSPRKDGPFIAINCGAIPKDLMESELFGYVEGAFTGAKRQGYKGKFEQAHKGTLFLDEIGEIPPSMQVALLRVLQERKVVPIGGIKEIPVDFRIITATHRDLTGLVNQGTFRKDLYYRLYVYPIHVPPLRERKEDIPFLVRFLCQKHNWNIPWADTLFDKLNDHTWPGNIRELHNVLERINILWSNGATEDDLFLYNMLTIESIDSKFEPSIAQNEEHIRTNNELTAREKIQRGLMLEALQRTKGNVTAAAKLLDVPRSTFYKRLRKYGL
ncbi:sigma-54-dependent Fis family transcriptional regulator [Bacillus canaveralius]|uniref:Sigma-54-dependent Fis family transcriptional regulator n=1 Tax=Bacillus canaveralius TaxID=1403243 RepID=A0A2N5GJH0_9BACI|nr:sigma-54-dependent Fis family transcriptional regulator [Bacillus canaveralius]PLR81291.1 sigma-54-dependent Fis family transcriptional regulator [Bacillus canaveralius]PLS00509.1 sigma-54-dependent Fis family transcriptional regulator [Bacillus canaveralius]